MTETNYQAEDENPLQGMKVLTTQWANYFNGIQQILAENEQLRQRVAALESENAALTDTLEQWKNNDEWSNRVTYDNVVDQIASLEDASKRDDSRRLIEALLKKSQVNQFRRDVKKRVKELNEEGDIQTLSFGELVAGIATNGTIANCHLAEHQRKFAPMYFLPCWLHLSNSLH